MTIYAYEEELVICFMCGHEEFEEEKITVARTSYYTLSRCSDCGTEHVSQEDFPSLREHQPDVEVMNDLAQYQ